jgi:hypothetical protein
MTSKHEESSHLNFVHATLPNGLTISTCLICCKNIGSPTRANLRMAEEKHQCVLPYYAGKPKTAKQQAA